MKKIATMILVFMMFCTTAYSSGRYEKETIKAQALVYSALDYYYTHGKAAMLKEVQKKNGRFVDGSAYVFVMTAKKGTMAMLAHPMSPKLVGKNLWRLKDTNKKSFIQEYYKVVTTKGRKGWVNYYWKHPISNKIEPKNTFCVSDKDKKLSFYSGFYMLSGK